ncbi:MAG: aldo/keto reductase [Alphaproteobacteria bacterium]
MQPTDRRRLGATDVEVTALGFGAAPLGSVYEVLDEDVCRATVQRAYDLGVRLYDTAPLYGHGLSELRLGAVLRQKPRDSFVLSTKIGRYLAPGEPGKIDMGQWQHSIGFATVYDYSYDGAFREVEQSMMRLGIPRIDVLLIHDVDVWTHGDGYEQRYREAMEGSYRAARKMRDDGTVRAIGVGVNEADVCARFARDGDFDCFLLAGRYTLLEQGALDDFLPLCVEKNIGIMLGGPYNSGILATGAIPGAKYNYVDATPEILDRVSRIQAVCQRHGVPLAAAALQFPLAHPAMSALIPGAVTPYEVQRNANLMAFPIPADLWAELKHEGLVRADAPVPG